MIYHICSSRDLIPYRFSENVTLTSYTTAATLCRLQTLSTCTSTRSESTPDMPLTRPQKAANLDILVNYLKVINIFHYRNSGNLETLVNYLKEINIFHYRNSSENPKFLVDSLTEINLIHYRNSSEKVGIPAKVGKVASVDTASILHYDHPDTPSHIYSTHTNSAPS